MSTTQIDDEDKTKKNHGLLKLILMVVGFIIFMILIKYILDMVQ